MSQKLTVTGLCEGPGAGGIGRPVWFDVSTAAHGTWRIHEYGMIEARSKQLEIMDMTFMAELLVAMLRYGGKELEWAWEALC